MFLNRFCTIGYSPPLFFESFFYHWLFPVSFQLLDVKIFDCNEGDFSHFGCNERLFGCSSNHLTAVAKWGKVYYALHKSALFAYCS